MYMYLKQKSNSQSISRFCIVLESLFESKRERKVLIIILNWNYINRKWFVSAKGFIDTKTIILWMALGPLNTYYYYNFYDYYYCIL